MLDEFEQIGQQALDELRHIADSSGLEAFRIKYLGRKGKIVAMLGRIGQLAAEQRRQGGQLANKIKKEVTCQFEQLKEKLSQSQSSAEPLVDVTLPGEAMLSARPSVSCWRYSAGWALK